MRPRAVTLAVPRSTERLELATSTVAFPAWETVEGLGLIFTCAACAEAGRTTMPRMGRRRRRFIAADSAAFPAPLHSG